MNVQNCLNNIPETNLGYIRMIVYSEGGQGSERTFDTYTNRELIDILNKQASAYYQIGEYWYIVYKS